MSDETQLKKAVIVLGAAAEAAKQQGAKKLPTFAKAKAALLDGLNERGWDITYELKVPHATSPDKLMRLWFKPQAVYLSTVSHGLAWSGKNHHDFKSARSITEDMRPFSVDSLIALAERRAR